MSRKLEVLRTLHRVARLREDRAAAELRTAQTAQTRAAATVGQLRDYGLQYRELALDSRALGARAGLLADAHAFGTRLDTTAADQEGAVERARFALEAARARMAEAQRRVDSLRKLAARAESAERRAVERRALAEVEDRLTLRTHGTEDAMPRPIDKDLAT